MTTFTPAGFATYLTVLDMGMREMQRRALNESGKLVQEECKRVLGTYEYGWSPLAPSTLARKKADTPGLETGEMQASIEYTADASMVEIGSDNEKLVWFELGTSRQPPRSVLAEALHRKTPEVIEVFKAHLRRHFFLP